MKKEKNLKDIVFWIIIAALIIIFAAAYPFAVGQQTIVLALIALTLLVGVYKLISILGRKHAKGAKIIGSILTVLVCLGLGLFAVTEVFVIGSAHTDKDSEAQYIVVLGAGINGTEPSLSLTYRLKAAKEYLEENPDTFAVVSGGQGPGEDITEAECMRCWLTENEISEDRILMEQKSTSTYENLRNSFELIRENGGDPSNKVAILSDEYHLYRAKYYARELGANPVGVAAHNAYPIITVNYFVREAFAVAYMWILENYLGHS